MKKKIDLIIVGTQKAGTSSLLNILSQHPDMISHTTGELGFFIKDEEYNKGYEKLYSKYFPPCEEGKLLIAKNVGIFENKTALERVKAHNPKVKIVVSLRDPVDRAYSGFWYMKSIGAERAEKFEDIMDLDVKERFPDDAFMIRSCDYLNRGRYHHYLQQLEEVFDRDQVLVMDFRDLKKDGVAFCNRIFSFAGVKAFDVDNTIRNKSSQIRYVWIASFFGGHNNNFIKRILSNILPPSIRLKAKNRIKWWNRADTPIPKLNPETKKELSKRFVEQNELLDRDYGIKF